MSIKAVDIKISARLQQIAPATMKLDGEVLQQNKSKGLVWMTREEFNRSLMLQEMSVTSLKALMNFATCQSIAAKEDAMNAFSINDLTSYNRLNLDYLNWNGLSTACLNEVNQRGKA